MSATAAAPPSATSGKSGTPERPVSHTRAHEYKFSEVTLSETQAHLAKSAEWAAALLDKLTSDKSDDAMPAGVLASCEGLAFIAVGKGALGLTYASGHGFVIRKLDHDAHGHALWSPPVFVKVSQLGFGVSAGYEHTDSALALMNLTTIARFTDKHTIGGADLAMFSTSAAVSGVPAGTFGRGSHLEITADNQTTSFCYSASSGVLVNLSINGTETQPDKHWNEKLYGSNDPETLTSVIDGKVDNFKELLPLYRKIAAITAKAVR